MPPPETSSGPLAAGGAPGRVLLVEPDEELAGRLQEWLEGFYGEHLIVTTTGTVEETESAVETLDALELAIVDDALRDGDGRDLAETVHARFDAITVLVTDEDPDSGLVEVPVDGYLLKPLDEATLLKRLSLVEKLEAAGVVEEYSKARRASLLEYHLDAPNEDRRFRQFAAMWSYDRLEVACVGNSSHVYELYTGDSSHGTGRVSVSVVGSLDTDVQSLVDGGELSPVGELVPTEEGYAWVGAGGTPLDCDSDAIAIYRFTGDSPEEHVGEAADDSEDTIAARQLRTVLEEEFN